MIPLTQGYLGKADDKATLASVYQVAVYTGDIADAGTDSYVWLWVDGTAGRSGWLYLDNSENNFERGSTDYFDFNLPDLGALTEAWIYFRPSGAASGWYLSTVVVNGKTFSYNNWLTTEGQVRLTAT